MVWLAVFLILAAAWLIWRQPRPSSPVNHVRVIVNGRAYWLRSGTKFTYEDACRFADARWGTPSCIFSEKDGLSRTMYPGCRPMLLTKDAVVNVAHTGAA